MILHNLFYANQHLALYSANSDRPRNDARDGDLKMKPTEVTERLGIQSATLRLWAGEFGEYLSPSARGGDGRHRAYSDQDVQILTYIAQMKDQNIPLDEIHASLKSLRGAGWAGLPDIPAAPPGVGPIAMIPREAAETQIKEQQKAVTQQVQLLMDRVTALDEALKIEREEKGALLKERADLMQQIGKLTGQLSERQDTRYWIERIGWVIIFAIVLAVALILLARG